jgi:hypothetical protein
VTIWGEFLKSVKFLVEEPLADGSYLSWIYPPGKLRKRGSQPIQVRVIEYIIEHPNKPGEMLSYRLITSLLNIELFAATLLAVEYHQRWEIENTIDEIKTHLNGRKTPIRSGNPREVVQEVYGWLLGHWAVRFLMFQAASEANIAPLRLSFTGTLRVIRRALPKFQRLQIEELAAPGPGFLKSRDEAQRPFFQLVDVRDSG